MKSLFIFYSLFFFFYEIVTNKYHLIQNKIESSNIFFNDQCLHKEMLWKNSNKCQSDGLENLYIITPIFNVDEKRKELYFKFKNYIKKFNVNFLTIECLIGHESEFQVTSSKDINNIQVRADHLLWMKENLINIAVNKLPKSWKYFIWLDSDIEFLEDDWPYKILEAFEKYDIIQPFKHLSFLGPDNEQVLSNNLSFMYCYLNRLPIMLKYFSLYIPHTGIGFGLSKFAFNTIEKINDISIIGSGDNYLAYSFINRVEEHLNKKFHREYKSSIIGFQKKLYNLSKYGRLGYADLSIKHFFHGYKETRKYNDRHNILVKHNYDPNTDIYYNDEGVIQLKTSKIDLILDIQNYFESRREIYNPELEKKYFNFSAIDIEEIIKRAVLLKKLLESEK